MPAALTNQRRRFLSMVAGRMIERVDEKTRYEYNHLAGVHLVNITFRKVVKDNLLIGETIILHLIDEADYWMLELWMNSAYAKAFYNVMENINLNEPLTIITNEYEKEGKKKQALFAKQFNGTLKWKYTKDNMQDCPRLEQIPQTDGSTKWDDSNVILFFLDKITRVMLPALQKKINPYPWHPTFNGINGNNIAGEYFGKETHHRAPGPISSDEKNGFNANPAAIAGAEVVDDLPF